MLWLPTESKRLGSCWREVGTHLCRLIRSSSSRRRKDSSWSMKLWNREMQNSPDAACGKLWVLEKESEARPELAEGRGQGAVVATNVPKGCLAHLHRVTSPHTQTTSPSSRQSLRRWTVCTCLTQVIYRLIFALSIHLNSHFVQTSTLQRLFGQHSEKHERYII